jgi:uncharacterized protein (TIGR03066 family)
MKLLRWTLVGCLAIALAGCGSPASDSKSSKDGDKAEGPKKEATNKDKIVGTWEPAAKPKPGDPDSVEFTADGKIKATGKDQDGKPVTMEGAYTVDGDKIITVLHGPDGKPLKGPDGKEMKQTLTITKLTDTELVTKDEMGKTDELKKKK